MQASVVVVCGLLGVGVSIVGHRLSSCGHGLSYCVAGGIFWTMD